MRRLSFLLRPGWLALIALCGVFAYLCFTVLAPWQLGKNSRNSAQNDRISASLHEDPVPLAQLFPAAGAASTEAPAGSVTEDDEWRPVTATGTYLGDQQVLARLRTVDSDPAFEVLAPFRLDEGSTIIVDRGYVRPNQRMDPPPVDPPPSGTVTLDGRVRVAEKPSSDHRPIHEAGWPQVYSINTATIDDVTGLTLLDGYVQLDDDQPGGLGTIPLPNLDSGPYLSYGLQWLTFGIMAPLGAGYFIWSEIRERRRRRPPAPAAPGAASTPADPHGPAGFDSPPPASTSGTRPEGYTDAGADTPAEPAPTTEVEDEEFTHVLRGRRKPKPQRAVRAEPERPAPVHDTLLTDAQRRTLAHRYDKKP